MEVFGFSIPVVWTLIGGCITLIYVYGKRRNRFLKDAGFPGPEPYIYLGNLPQVFAKQIDVSDEARQKYGDVYGSWLGGIPVVNVTDPEIIKEVLIKDFPDFSERMTFGLKSYPLTSGMFFRDGAPWKRLRTLSSPTFSGVKLRAMCESLNACARKLVRNFVRAAENKEVIEVKTYFGAFTMDAIAATAFGIDTDAQSDFENIFIKEVRKAMDNSFLSNPVVFIVLIFPGLAPLFQKFGIGAFSKSTTRFFDKYIRQIIEHRKQEPEEMKKKRVDFLRLMLDAVDDTFDGEKEDSSDSDSAKHQNKLTTGEVIGQVFLFFLAGYDTTSSTLNFVSYCLATHPDVQEKMLEEIRSALGDSDPDYDNVQKLVYMDWVINETQRMYPVVPALNRRVSKTTTIKGWTFPAGVFVNIPTLVMHRNPNIFPEPEKFKPERWEKKSDINPMRYLPFGEGPRQCIGMRLALLELKMALVHTLKAIRFVRLDDTPDDRTDFKLTGGLTTKTPIKLRVELR